MSHISESSSFDHANNLRFCKQYEDAICCYKNILTQENSSQEKYMSCFYLHQCFEALNEKEHGFFYLVKSMKYDLERVECLHQLVMHYCRENMQNIAYEYYKIISPHFFKALNDSSITNSKLNLNLDVSNFFLPYYMIIVADRVNDRACGVSMYEIIFKKKHRMFAVWYLNNLFFNLRFFVSHASPEFASSANEYLSFLQDNGVNLLDFKEIANGFDYESHGIDLLLKTKQTVCTNKTSLIPKRMMQTWEHKQLNPQFQEIVDTWKKHNPHYEFALLDSTEREQFIQKHFEKDVVYAYQQIIPGAYKSDLFRYCYLWVEGGVYADIDTLCMGKLDDFLVPEVDFVVPIDLNSSPHEGTHNLSCGFFASVPRHPILMWAIQKIVHNVKHNIVPSSKLDFSGPGILGRAVNEFLNRNETESFVGKEGIYPHHSTLNNYKGIHFLKFEPRTELKKNKNDQIIFQNKNGNHEVARLYHDECCKLNKFVCWVNCASPIAATSTSKPKAIALMVHGQFRSYANNLRKNIKNLAPIFEGFVVYVFVLSDKLASGNYSKENENDIKSIFNEFGFNVCLFDYVENLDTHAESEQKVHDFYFSNLKTDDGIGNKFVPRLMYRKFVVNQLKNAYCKQHNISIDLHIYARLFDIIISFPNHVKSFPQHEKRIKYEINKLITCSSDALTVLGSSDTLFIGTQKPMDHLFECVVKNMRGPEIWNDNAFYSLMVNCDSVLCICKSTYSPEVQTIAHVHFSEFKYKNIRFDFNSPKSLNNASSLFDVILDPVRIQVNHPKICYPKICFITAVYGKYEASCKRFEKQTVPTDFICFTDNQNMVSNGWIIDTTPYHLTHKSKVDNSTFVNSISNNKHTFNIAKYYKQSFSNVPRLKKYDVIVWLDGTIEITHNKTSEYVLSKIYKEKIIGWHHEWRNGRLQGEVVGSHFYRYTSTFWNNQHQPYQDINKQYNDYIQDGYTDDFFKQIQPGRRHFGVWITCFVAFLQHDPAVQNFLELWYLQTLKYTTQDQIGFPYVCQKTKLIPYTLPDNEIHGTPHSHTMFYIKHDHGK